MTGPCGRATPWRSALRPRPQRSKAPWGGEIERLKAYRFINKALALGDGETAVFAEITGTTEEAAKAIGSLNKMRVGKALQTAMFSLGNQILMETMTFWSPTSQNTLGLDPPTDGFKLLEYSLS